MGSGRGTFLPPSPHLPPFSPPVLSRSLPLLPPSKRANLTPPQREPYEFSDLLFLSRVFLSSADEMEEDPNAALNAAAAAASGGGGKKNKKKKAKAAHEQAKSEEQVWMYHAEDEFIARVRSLPLPLPRAPS